MKIYYHDDAYFEKTPIEKQRVCCNCLHRNAGESICTIDGRYIGYVACFTAWCRKWASDELRWKEQNNE